MYRLPRTRPDQSVLRFGPEHPMKYAAVLTIFLVCAAGRAVMQEGTPVGARTSSLVDDTNHVRPDSGRAQEPYSFVSSGTMSITPGSRYDAGRLQRWFYGEYYRDVWTMSLEVPVIDLAATAGGLTPLNRGGGNQTATLHLLGGDGHFYDLRSVDKDVTDTLPEKYRGTIVERVVQDQISSLNPVGAMIVPPLARAAGILHTSPTLVLIPDSPLLGSFRDEFGGTLALFERDPDENQSDAARFGFSKNIVGTKKLLEKLRVDRNNHVDERAFARARLFDMLIGDWDRHEGQWRWAEFETERGTRFVPVPTDRDAAFAKFDGLLLRLGRLTGKMMLRRMTNFDDDIPDVFGLNWQGIQLDRRLTTSLTRDDWLAIADSLQIALPDDVIDRAVKTWPQPVYDLIGPMTAHNLKSRLRLLPSAAARYYDVLSDPDYIAGR